MNVVSSGGLGGFLEAGFEAFLVVRDGLRRAEAFGVDVRRVLDFGCGCGRILRLWEPDASAVELYGCDVDHDAVKWVRQNIDFVTVKESSVRPPLPYETDSFDFLYGVSIFSHLEEDNHKSWLDELARVVSPGGFLLLTTHGPMSLELLEADPARVATVGLDQERVEFARKELDSSGYAFCRQPGVSNDDLYGMTFMSPEYVEKHWSRQFDIVDHEPLRLQSWQDVILLRCK